MKFQDYIKWYSNRHLHYLIALPSRLREFSILASSKEERTFKNTRNLRCHRPQDLQFFWRALRIIKDKLYMNFYHSICRYERGVPPVALNQWRDMTEWNLTCREHIIDYPFLIDIDCDSHDQMEQAKEGARKILIDLLEKKHNGIFLSLSGMGFHILVPMEQMTKNREFDDRKPNNIYDEYKKKAREYHDKFCGMVDLNIYDHRRLMKCPYSLAVYDDCMVVAHPFSSSTIEEFLNFDLNRYKIENYVLTNNTIILPLIKWQTEKDRLQLLKKLKTQ